MLAPVEASGDHEVEDQPQIAFKADGDAFTDAAQAANLFFVCGGERRINGAEKEWARQADALESLAQDTRLQCFDVDGDVGEFGQCVYIVWLWITGRCRSRLDWPMAKRRVRPRRARAR